MSENMGTSESTTGETASFEPTEPAQPEPVAPPKKGDQKKLWIMIVAVIVAIALIGTVLVVLVLPPGDKDLTASITPDPVEIDAGDQVSMSVAVDYGDDDVSDDADLSWSVDPASLGSFNVVAQTTVTFTAGNAAGTGTISCDVEYDGKTVTAEVDVTVAPPYLEGVNILPSTKSLDLDQEWTFNASAVDSVGNAVADVTFSWTVAGIDAGDYTLSATTGASVVFSASVMGTAYLNATATKGTESASGSATVIVGSDSDRSVDTYWYDLFDHPLGPWYEVRADTSGEWALTDEYPYLYIWEGSPPGNIWIYTFMRMDMDARNVTEVSMSENPVFLPILSPTVQGGTAEIDWYLNYITEEETERLGPAAESWYDGWYVALNGTVTLDEEAAKSVMNMSSSDFDDFSTWWAANKGKTENAWSDWMVYEASAERLAIWNMYEYDLQFILFDLEAEKVGDQLVVTMDTVSWGAEALLTRWLKESFMPTEWYFEDMTFQATIGPERSDVYINSAIQYAAYAYETTLDFQPCWDWEALMQDYVPAPDGYPRSLYDLYWNDATEEFTYYNVAPGSDWYDKDMQYDYAPGAWNLSANETLTFEWPAGEQLFFVHDPEYEGETLVDKTRPYYNNMTVSYAEPMPSDDPDKIVIDEDSRTITYTGPFDMWTWSKEQTAHEWLAEEWDRMNLLPYGIPFVEFAPDIQGAEPELVISGLEGPLDMGETATFTVTIQDKLSLEVIEDYDGTVNFTSNDPMADLPDDYTFVPGDLGSHEFTVTFNSVNAETHSAVYYVTVVDTVDETLSDTVSGIVVIEQPRIADFLIEFTGDDVIATEPTEVTISALNQWDEVYEDYAGMVDVTSDDVGAVGVPAALDFTDADGVQVVEITFSTAGLWTVNATDQNVSEATNEESVTVMAEPAAHHFVLTGVESPVMIGVAKTLNITVIDQYGRDFTGYDGTVEFESNQTTGVTLPAPTAFTLGNQYLDVELTFTEVNWFTVYCNDTVEPGLIATPPLMVRVVSELPELDHFTVTGLVDMWENNYSSVTVTAIDQYDFKYPDYVGTIAFSTNAPMDYELPTDYTFLLGDLGTKTFANAVMFDEPGTGYNVTVEDTLDDTKNGTSADFTIIDLVATTMEIECDEDTVEQGEVFSVEVTVYHQGNEVFAEYVGTVSFETSDSNASGLVMLPNDYEFTDVDAGTHTFDGLSLNEIGSQTVTVDDGSLSAVLDIDVTEMVLSEITWRVYDMFDFSAGPWWNTRLNGTTWDTERILTSGEDGFTYMYNGEGTSPNGVKDRGMLYAPYRWNVSGTYLPNLNVSSPMFMPTFGSDTPGAEVHLDAWCEYVYQEWWDAWFIPTYETNPDWDDGFGTDFLSTAGDDGYITLAVINVTMNHEAAEEWMGMDELDDPSDWWDANRDTYISDWRDWLDIEGNDDRDIFNGYEWPYVDMITLMDLEEDGDDIALSIAHVSWGWEALLTRWLLASNLSVHQPYMEDIRMVVDYRDADCDFDLDGVAQWSMHCNLANGSLPGAGAPGAWVWEPIGFDYVEGNMNHPNSQYDVYADLTYQSWNVGDPQFTTEIPYEVTPWSFSLPEYGRLVVEVPVGDVVCYHGQTVPSDAMDLLFDDDSDPSAYEDIMYTGEMVYEWSEPLDGSDWWFNETGNCLEINGSFTFDNPRGGGLLYHGAPWIEFTVVESTKMAAAASVPAIDSGIVIEEPAAAGGAASSSTSVVVELTSLVSVMCAVLLTIAALVAGSVRRRDL